RLLARRVGAPRRADRGCRLADGGQAARPHGGTREPAGRAAAPLAGPAPSVSARVTPTSVGAGRGSHRFRDECPAPFPEPMRNDQIEPLVEPYLPRDLPSFPEKTPRLETEPGGRHPPGDVPEIEP